MRATLKKPCKEWTGATITGGYGQRRRNGKQVLVHREAWERKHGPIPAGLWVLHRCDNPPCYEVSHLFLGTQTDNMRDMANKGRGRLPTKEQHVRGERHPHATLTDKEVAQIRKRYAKGGVLQRELAEEFGVTQQHISGIVNYERRCVAQMLTGLACVQP